MSFDVEDFEQQKECVYKEERYSVRDNGAVMRHCRTGKRPRPTDNQWTFGKPNEKTGYMDIGTERVHRIVATAFHGNPPTSQHVADHIDTNRKNNRPENIRWLTKLENALNNPITRRRIEISCGSIEAFIENPSLLKETEKSKDIAWMRQVSPQEAKNCYENLLKWANSDKLPSSEGKLGEWIYQETNNVSGYEQPSEIIDSITSNAVQKKWQTPSEFPCCPQEYTEEPIKTYASNLIEGSVFCRNGIYSSLVLKSAILEDKQSIYVISESTEGKNAVKPWALANITFENGKFVHTSIGSFFSQEGAEKQFTLAQGLDWTGGDSIDDYC
jgi:hypothetical protein